MKGSLFAVTAASFALGLTGAPASAAGQPICGAHDDVASDLEKKYAETPSARGLATAGLMIEVFSSPEGTFTIVATRPDGTSCLLAVGEAWHKLATFSAPSESS
jgi:hypothetical protein